MNVPCRGMLGSTANGRLMGPGVGSSTSSSSSSSSSSLQQQQSHTAPHQQHQQLGHHPYSVLPSHHHHPLQPQHPALSAHHHRSIWPSLGAATGRSAFELQTATNGEGFFAGYKVRYRFVINPSPEVYHNPRKYLPVNPHERALPINSASCHDDVPQWLTGNEATKPNL
uniref:Uncharacterized protein n=1 Tax=Anopheles minimus TaxID=112268 RepID=A0A182VY80_9DIPT